MPCEPCHPVVDDDCPGIREASVYPKIRMPFSRARQLDWIDPLKAGALLAILWNHLTEEFGSPTWFTNPSRSWPDLNTRLGQIYPTEHPFPLSLLQFLGWLGDAAPGVFI